jgi:large subunit ribosomal protein L31e
MAETKPQILERIYVIPLRSEWKKVANYRRAGRAAKTIKKFIARHMKVADRDVDKVKLDIYLNNEVWFRGQSKPPAKIKVRAIKENDIVRVTLAENTDRVKFLKQKHDKRHKATSEPEKEEKKEAKKVESQEKIEEKKEVEKEKEQSAAVVKEAELKSDVKAAKHTSRVKEESHHRMALQK